MTAIIPNHNATAPATVAALPATPATRRERERPDRSDLPHGALQLAITIAAVALGFFAAYLVLRGFAAYAIPVGVLAVGILGATFLPDPLAARFDRLRAAEEDTEAGA